jgi:F-type H+-transporting ATPase subunit delta
MKVNPRAKRAARRLFRLCVAGGVLDEARVRRAAEGLTSSRRRNAVAILSHFHRLVRLDRDRHTAVVESAVPLGDRERSGVEADLRRRYGAGLRTAFVAAPELIGGMRIKVGGDVYDGSVRARLAALEARL